MGIQNWSENVILVNLAAEPDLGEEIQSVCEIVSKRTDQDVVMDFSDVEILTSSSIAKLLKLRKVLFDNQAQTGSVLRSAGDQKYFLCDRPGYRFFICSGSVYRPGQSADGRRGDVSVKFQLFPIDAERKVGYII